MLEDIWSNNSARTKANMPKIAHFTMSPGSDSRRAATRISNEAENIAMDMITLLRVGDSHATPLYDDGLGSSIARDSPKPDTSINQSTTRPSDPLR